ncbi:MAG TPA: hypothetical protein ENJ20_01065 [Bacteroidetes bacterium]|nr:hypothetical protein [Bacteroidota bacterium]
MKFFEKIFGSNPPANQPDIRFGRYSDAYHTPARDEAFDRAVDHFEQKRYLDAYKAFFDYLKNEEEDNVKIREENGTVKFEFFQGSKKITGFGNAQKLYAKAKIAKAKKLQASFMRRLLEKNFELKFCRFTLTPENEITIAFDTYTEDGAPFKLYAALKELATHADKQDDLLLDEFDSLEPAGLYIRRKLPDWEKEVKYNYIIQQVQAAFDEIDTGQLNHRQYPVAGTYLLLFLCYKLDYLVKPEGYMMETLERIHRLAYGQDGKNAAQKNQLLRKEFEKLIARPKDLFFKEMYEVTATFGITTPIDHQKVKLAIDQELPHAKWYRQHGHDAIAIAIPGFIASRCLFYFAMPQPDKDLFHLLLQILEADYFEKLGFQNYCTNGLPNEKKIKKQIREIAARHRPDYPLLRPDTRLLRFDSMPELAASFCLMIRELDI